MFINPEKSYLYILWKSVLRTSSGDELQLRAKKKGSFQNGGVKRTAHFAKERYLGKSYSKSLKS